MSHNPPTQGNFQALNLPQHLLDTIDELGYETPSPIQAQTIPFLLAGKDVLGHAPTGTGKTAAFALPLLSRINTGDKSVQLLVLTPTRELAIQVAEALQRYAAKMKGFHVLPIYGGQDYNGQFRQLKRGVQAVVGTPGRVMDHLRRGTLKLQSLQAFVLDEADEMLRMGFIDDVEWILEQLPDTRQMALFSATMPKQIERIARRHLNQPAEVSIAAKTATAETINQRYWMVSGLHKLDALTRILEVESFDAMLIFVRTRLATAELTEKLAARGHSAAALNGDMPQKQREKVVSNLKQGKLDVVIATDVAARGLDVERISHVLNFDIPYDTEAYIHRIGRTGRAGRTGEAILFVTPREQRLLKSIEKVTRQKIAVLDLPSTEMVNNKRIADFKQLISDTLASGETAFMQSLVEQYRQEHNVPSLEIAAALAKMYVGDQPLTIKPEKQKKTKNKHTDKKNKNPTERSSAAKDQHRQSNDLPVPKKKRSPGKADKSLRVEKHAKPKQGMERFRLSVGSDHNVQASNIVAAIANDAGLDAMYIGHVDIRADHSFVDLPEGMPRAIFRDLKKAWVCGQKLGISRTKDIATKKEKANKTTKHPGKNRKRRH